MIKCAVGKRGITIKKKEGDNKTPAGNFKFETIFYRKDRISLAKTYLQKIVIKKNMGWCDDSSSKFYNKLIKFPFLYNAEKLWLTENVYDVVVIINYNINPVVKKKRQRYFFTYCKKKL